MRITEQYFDVFFMLFKMVLTSKSVDESPTAPCKRTQHCWPTTPNIVGCYMLRPIAHPVACCWMLLRVVATPNISFVP